MLVFMCSFCNWDCSLVCFVLRLCRGWFYLMICSWRICWGSLCMCCIDLWEVSCVWCCCLFLLKLVGIEVLWSWLFYVCWFFLCYWVLLFMCVLGLFGYGWWWDWCNWDWWYMFYLWLYWIIFWVRCRFCWSCVYFV